MAQTQREFFETAIARSGSLNATSLARKIGVHRTTISEWKRGKSVPSDKTMLKIALICDLDPVEALALLNLWRCDDAAKGAYLRLLEVAQSTALKCFPYIFALILASQGNEANALNLNENSSVKISHNSTIYTLYGNKQNTRRNSLRLFLRRVLRRLAYAIFGENWGLGYA